MQKFLRRANTKLTIGWAAAMLSGMSLVSMMLSLFRERLLNTNFGVNSLDLDAYRVAFKVPDFMFVILVSGALSVTFIPILNERLMHRNKKSAWELTSNLINFLSGVTLVASVAIFIFANPIINHLLAPGMDPEGQQLAALMMRIIAINPFLFAISSVLTSVQQAVGRFFFFALAPAIYSFGIIIGILVFAPHLGILGVAYGVVLGSLAQLFIGALGMVGLGFNYQPIINWKNQGFRETLRMLPQRSVDQGMDYFNNLVEISIASRLRTGLINSWEVAYTLHWVPVNLIGIAISTAAFPKMSERISQGRPDLFRKEFVKVFRILIWLALPVSVVAFLGRGYLVRLLVAEGNTTIANLLGLLVGSMIFRAMFHLISRSFYAHKDTKTPLIVSVYAISLNVILAIFFVLPIGLNWGISGLALAQSIAAGAEVAILITIMQHRYEHLFDLNFLLNILKMMFVAISSGIIMYALLHIFPLRVSDVGFFALVPKFAVIVAVTLISYVIGTFAVGIDEAKPVIDRFMKIVFRPVRFK